MPAEAIRAFLSGRAAFRAEGGFPDLFLEACAANGVPLREVRQENGVLTAQTDDRSYPRVQLAARRSGMTVTAVRRTGLPQLLRRYRSRIGIPVGVLLGALLLAFLSGRIWEVTVTGNRRVGAEEILDVLEELGVAPGAAIGTLDARAVSRQAGARLPQLSWIAVNLDGCKARVEVREMTEAPPLTEERDYCNLVAALDGVIVSADVLEGAGQPTVGSAVVRGDLLVSGIIEMKNGFQRFVSAKAHVRARTRTTLTVQTAASFPAERLQARASVCRLSFFGLRVTLGIRQKNGETEQSGYWLQSRKTVYPVGVLREDTARYETRTVSLPEEDAALLCFADFCAQAYGRYREAALLHRDVFVTVKNGTARVSAKCECVEEIAERQPFAVDDKR